MKQLLLLIFCWLFITANVLTQTSETFDVATFKPPAGWKKQPTENAVQYMTEDAKTGASCIIMLTKAIPGLGDPKANFDAAWETMVKGMVTISTPPEMQAAEDRDGWEILNGYAPFVSENSKGVVILITASGYKKMVNLIIFTNTNIYEKNISDFLASVSLKKPNGEVLATTVKNAPIKSPPPTSTNGFGFSTTNFDDGWTSTVQEDWVQVTKGNIKVLVHYPNKNADAYNSVVMDGLRNAWNVLVAPRYSAASNFEFKPITGWQSIEFAEADAVEKKTGKTVHVVLFKMNYSSGAGRYLEFITTNKNAFEQEFGAYHTTTSGWEKMENMASYNKFAVAATDLNGKWTNDFTSAIQYVNAYTGANAGMDTHASVQNFVFGGGKTYHWNIAVASGQVGNIKFQSVKSSGKFSVPNNWQITFSDIEGKPRTFNAYFSCVKGARILWLDTTAFGKID